MTEEEWLACGDPTRLLLFIKSRRTMGRRVKQRKQQLFAAACCRRLQSVLGDNRGRHCIEVVERFADDRATTEELQAAETDARQVWLRDATDDAAFAYVQLCEKELTGLRVSTTAISAVFKKQQTDANRPLGPLDGRRSGACPSEERAQCVLLRDIVGNPFRPITADPRWLTSTALTLARQMYESRDFAPMPILADALEEAGCDNADILSHCRSVGPHVRGCWVVDLVLGKC